MSLLLVLAETHKKLIEELTKRNSTKKLVLRFSLKLLIKIMLCPLDLYAMILILKKLRIKILRDKREPNLEKILEKHSLPNIEAYLIQKLTTKLEMLDFYSKDSDFDQSINI